MASRFMHFLPWSHQKHSSPVRPEGPPIGPRTSQTSHHEKPQATKDLRSKFRSCKGLCNLEVCAYAGTLIQTRCSLVAVYHSSETQRSFAPFRMTNIRPWMTVRRPYPRPSPAFRKNGCHCSCLGGAVSRLTPTRPASDAASAGKIMG